MSQLPPEAMIFRPETEDLDIILLSEEARLLRVLINLQSDEHYPWPSELAKKEQKMRAARGGPEARRRYAQRQRERARQLAAQQAEEVSDG
jgi:hypothetical protein